MTKIDTSDEAVERLAKLSEVGGRDITAATLRALLAERREPMPEEVANVVNLLRYNVCDNSICKSATDNATSLLTRLSLSLKAAREEECRDIVSCIVAGSWSGWMEIVDMLKRRHHAPPSAGQENACEGSSRNRPSLHRLRKVSHRTSGNDRAMRVASQRAREAHLNSPSGEKKDDGDEI